MSTRSPTRPKRRIALAAAQLLLPDANPQCMEIDNFHELTLKPLIRHLLLTRFIR